MQKFSWLLLITLLLACREGKAPQEGQVRFEEAVEVRQERKALEADTVPAERKGFHDISEFADRAFTVWLPYRDSSASLSLHFNFRDMVSIVYSPECVLSFPYKARGERLIVYWNRNIDTKYEFDIVKAIKKTDPKLVGKPFMVLEQNSDTTLKATYPMKDLVSQLNRVSKGKTYFAKEYRLQQPGEY